MFFIFILLPDFPGCILLLRFVNKFVPVRRHPNDLVNARKLNVINLFFPMYFKLKVNSIIERQNIIVPLSI